jgi:hypothetical protein
MCAAGDLSGKHTMSLWNEYRDPDINLFGEMSVVGKTIVVGSPGGSGACATIIETQDAPTWAPTGRPTSLAPTAVPRAPLPPTPVPRAPPATTLAPRAAPTPPPAAASPTFAPSPQSLSFTGKANIYFLLEGGTATGFGVPQQTSFQKQVAAMFPSLKRTDQVQVKVVGDSSNWDKVKSLPARRRQASSQVVVVAGIDTSDKSVSQQDLKTFASLAAADLNMSSVAPYKVKMVAYNGVSHDTYAAIILCAAGSDPLLCCANLMRCGAFACRFAVWRALRRRYVQVEFQMDRSGGLDNVH